MAKYNGKTLKFGDTIYYEDELNDDFEPTSLERKPLPDNYRYSYRSKWHKFYNHLIYYSTVSLLIPPFCYLAGVRKKFLDKKAFKEYRKQGGFIYSNHTSFLDMIDIQTIFKTKITRIVGYTDALDMPVAKHLVGPFGYLPLPDTIKSSKAFLKALEEFTNAHESVIIYPEAHVWPYYTDIRPFISTSFKYPAKLNKPALPITACYRKSKLSKKPKITLYIGTPVYPKEELSLKENTEYLRNECYKQMKEAASKYSTYKYINYVKKEKTGDN